MEKLRRRARYIVPLQEEGAGLKTGHYKEEAPQDAGATKSGVELPQSKNKTGADTNRTSAAACVDNAGIVFSPTAIGLRR